MSTLSAPIRLALHSALLVGILAAPTAVSGQDPDARAVLARAAARFDGFETLCADFHQVVEITLLRQTTEGEGVLCQQRPGLFSMRFSAPEGDLVVVDGTYVWAYYPSLDTQQVYRFQALGGEEGFDLYRTFLHRPEERFEVTYEGSETVTGHDAHRLELVPIEPSGFKRAIVWIDDASALLVRVQVFDTNNTVRTVDLSNTRIDPPLEPGIFTFTPPAGARVTSG